MGDEERGITKAADGSEAPAQARDQDHPGLLAQRLVLGLAGVVLLAFILIKLKAVLLPTVLAFLVCCVLNPVVEAFNRRGVPRLPAVALTLAVGAGLVWLVLNHVLASLSDFREGLPPYAAKLGAMAGRLADGVSGRLDLATLSMIRERLADLSLGAPIAGLVDNFVSLTGHLALTLLFTLYFLPALPGLPDKVRAAFEGRRGERLGDAVLTIIDQVQRYVLAKTSLSLGLAAAVTVACHAFGVDFATTWGVFAFFLNFIPNLGVPVAVLPPVMVYAAQRGLGPGLWLLATLSVLQLISANLVEPKVLGRSVNLSPTATILSILVWGWIWGLVGMILAVPLMAVVKLACQNIPSLRPVASLMGG
jgi:predicted PurR-regulated permease PerM